MILGLLWLHSAGLPIYGLARGYGIGHSLLEGAAVGVIALLAMVQPWGRRGASALVSFGLISSSAILVHLSAGAIEAHFHFFVMIAVVALYEDWIPFLVAFGYVAVHHAVVGSLFPSSVFNHSAAVANPGRWALIHAFFVSAAAIAAIVGWRLNESVRGESVRAQEDLAESERALTEAQSVAHLGSWEWDRGSNEVTWSPELYRLLGLDPGAGGAGYERFFEMVHPDDRRRVEQDLERAISTGDRFAHHLRLTRPDGTERILLSQGKVAQAQHDHSRTMVGTLQDVTERRRAEEQLTRLNLQQASILNSAGDGIYGIDEEGWIIFANPAAAALTGYAEEEVVGRRKHDLVHHSKPDGSPYPYEECPIVQALRNAMPYHAVNDLFWRKDGSGFPVEYTATPIREKGEVRGAVVVFRDITERCEIDRLKAEFTSVVSHELRTPLTSIRGSLGLLAGGVLGPLPAKGQRMLAIAVTNTDRLIRLINEILDIERIESGQAPLQPREIGVADILGQAVELMDAMAHEAGISLVPRPVEAKLWADPDRLTQTLTNLISNAIKFSPPGTTVSVTARRSGAEIVFTVADQGRGIPPNQLETIFERFHQVDGSDSREKGGTGLGLAICRSIVEQHGGRIWAESAPAQGATFLFALPAPTDHETIAGGGTEPGVLVAGAAPSRLVVAS